MGWIVFAIASFTYLSTIEPTASLWDCGEYIATSYKLEVGHPPGAPFFLLMGRLFSMFAAPEKVAMMVNSLSALVSAFSILFLFWSITLLAKKLYERYGEIDTEKTFAIMGAGLVGSLAYTFSDSFWFSAVEGEVYAMSSFFTAMVFWAILKWESVAHEKHSVRWLVLISYLIGLSIGVHLLNLLAIPAIVYVYYFKKNVPTTRGIVIAGLVGVAILGFVQVGLIPGIVSLAAKFELLSVNTLGLPFNVGTIIYFLILIGSIVYGLHWSKKKNHPNYNAIILGFAVLLIGYSSFFTIVIRSQANPPIDENNPENAISLLSYLNRDQYGSQPLLFGPYYNAQIIEYEDDSPIYVRDDKSGKYIISDDRKGTVPVYDPKFKTFFPRMHSSQASHQSGYKAWADIKGTPIRITDGNGETKVLYKPTFGENLTFFFRYQLGYMYFRYFMWNFVGRQNDIQGSTGNSTEGNWISGIPFVDNILVGDTSQLPESMSSNKGMNKFYFLPLILGLLGLYYQYKKAPEDSLVIFMLFIFTGVAIIVYLNNTPFQPRERDYGYVGSFYAFAIWIGLGVLFVIDAISKYLKGPNGAVVATALCLLAVPTLMAKEGWDDHNRSGRYTARDFAKNYLDSCEPNAILFTNGDNDTFPLWYVQEVEGYRTDIRVVNLSLLQTDWYIEQMKKQAYDGLAVPFSMTAEQTRQGTRDFVPVMKNGNVSDFVDVKKLIDFVKSEDNRAKVQLSNRKFINYFPTSKVRVPVDSAKVLANGTVRPEDAGKIVKALEFDLNRTYVIKNDLMVLDLLAHNNWDRPIYFAITTGKDAYLNLEKYFQLEGLAYRLTPIEHESADGQIGRVHVDKLYDNLVNKFSWGNMNDPNIYLDENNLRMTLNFRNIFYRLAEELMKSGDSTKALNVVDKAIGLMPESTVPYDYTIVPLAEVYLQLKQYEKADVLYNRVIELYAQNIKYFASLSDRHARTIPREMEQSFQVYRQMMYHFQFHKRETLQNNITEKVKGLPLSGESRVYNEIYQKYFASQGMPQGQ